jgi:hypothetical protein
MHDLGLVRVSACLCLSALLQTDCQISGSLREERVTGNERPVEARADEYADGGMQNGALAQEGPEPLFGRPV